jgi:hypothetical protein
LDKVINEDKKRYSGSLQALEKLSNDSLREKNEALSNMFRELQETKQRLSDEIALTASLKDSSSVQSQEKSTLQQHLKRLVE